MTHQEYMAVKKFAEGLKGCFRSRMKDDSLINTVLKYTNDIIDIHLQLAEIEFEQEAIKMEGYYAKTKV